MNEDEGLACQAGYPNAASMRYAERQHRLREQAEEDRKRKGRIATELRQRNQSGIEAASTTFTIAPNFTSDRG